MQQKTRLIIKLPYILSSEISNTFYMVLMCVCFAMFILGSFLPFTGAIISWVFGLIVWQFFTYICKNKLYKIYARFLIQRIALYIAYIISLFGFFVFYKNGIMAENFDMHIWFVTNLPLMLLFSLDIHFIIKGMLGIGFINVK